MSSKINMRRVTLCNNALNECAFHAQDALASAMVLEAAHETHKVELITGLHNVLGEFSILQAELKASI